MVDGFLDGPRSIGGFCLLSALRDAEREQNYEPERLILDEITTCEVNRIGNAPWEPNMNKVVDYYIESGLAKRRLDELVDSAHDFRLVFQKAFTISDALWA